MSVHSHADKPSQGRQFRVTIARRDFDAAIFDLDGVLTDTARVHAAAWKALFDPFLKKWAGRRGVPFEAFRPGDYLTYIDGRTRLEGIRAFLAARNIELPEDSELEHADTLRGLSERKAELFRQLLQGAVPPQPGAEALLGKLREAGFRIAVASSSKNCAEILRVVRFDSLIDCRVDGIDVERLGLPGKPDPALFVETARRVGVQPSRAVLFEDALAGVEAGRRGGFGRVVGIGDSDKAEALRAHGADLVIRSLDEVDVSQA